MCLKDQAASASALTLVARRLLSRAALFLWKMPLSATVSTTACILPNSFGSLGLVACQNGLFYILDRSAVFGTQRGIGCVDLDVLTDAFTARRQARVLFLGFSRCHYLVPCVCG
jgi:hypothetical protein